LRASTAHWTTEVLLAETTVEKQVPSTKLSLSNRIAIMQHYDRSRLFPATLLVPVLVFFLVWNIIPLLWMVGLSFYRYIITTGMEPRFFALGNYLDILNDRQVWTDLGRTFIWVFATVGTETFLGIVLGFVFWGSAKLPGRRIALTMLFTPMVLAPASVGTFFRLIYDPTFGVANYLLSLTTGTKIDFLGNPVWAFAAVVAVDVWMWTPFMILITLAALGSVPKAELEAAEVDRLPLIKRLWYVIWPHSRFILILGILLRTIDSFKTMDLVYLLTKGGPGDKTELIAIDLWRKAWEAFNMGWSSALALILLLIAISFTSFYLYILNLSIRRGQARV
jgi:multiple sugar transport system permease protein